MQCPLAFELGIGRKKWTHACASSCWFDGTSYSVVYVYRKGKYLCQYHAKMLDLNICSKRGCREEESTFMAEGTPPKKHIHNPPTTLLLFPPVRISRIPAVPLLERVLGHPRVCICTCGVSNKGWQGCRRRSAA